MPKICTFCCLVHVKKKNPFIFNFLCGLGIDHNHAYHIIFFLNGVGTQNACPLAMSIEWQSLILCVCLCLQAATSWPSCVDVWRTTGQGACCLERVGGGSGGSLHILSILLQSHHLSMNTSAIFLLPFRSESYLISLIKKHPPPPPPISHAQVDLSLLSKVWFNAKSFLSVHKLTRWWVGRISKSTVPGFRTLSNCLQWMWCSPRQFVRLFVCLLVFVWAVRRPGLCFLWNLWLTCGYCYWQQQKWYCKLEY